MDSRPRRFPPFTITWQPRRVVAGGRNHCSTKRTDVSAKQAPLFEPGDIKQVGKCSVTVQNRVTGLARGGAEAAASSSCLGAVATMKRLWPEAEWDGGQRVVGRGGSPELRRTSNFRVNGRQNHNDLGWVRSAYQLGYCCERVCKKAGSRQIVEPKSDMLHVAAPPAAETLSSNNRSKQTMTINWCD